MSDNVITVENLSKRYVIGHRSADRERYTALRDQLARNARNLWRKTADMARGRAIVAGDETEDFWALRDVSFEVGRGEVIGIIGRNGAGKSTLLKILSRITEPTEGRVRIRGRVASLLEVGTGFHPELTGRENIYLNGAILGMTQAEVRRKFDEIVAFAEVEKFLDTPVKRYSSGMYVRLAFAVAAHLEPEILVVDEVLAVGDNRFQQKCLGKMDELSKRGSRTVLIVSHNLAVVRSLASRAIVLDQGKVITLGSVDVAIHAYSQLQEQVRGTSDPRRWGRGAHTAIISARMLDENGEETSIYHAGAPMQFSVELETDGKNGISLEVFVVDATHNKIALASLHQFHGETLPTRPGRFRMELSLLPVWLASGRYSLDICTSIVNVGWDHYIEAAIEIDVPFSNAGGESWDFKQSYGYGSIALPLTRPCSAVALTD